jgi:hypothetical protein
LFPKDDENTCFVRTRDVDLKLSILFELCVLVEAPGSGSHGKSTSMSWLKFSYSYLYDLLDLLEVSLGWGKYLMD